MPHPDAALAEKFYIDTPVLADIPAILAIHQASYVDAYAGCGPGASHEALEGFVQGEDFITRRTAILRQRIAQNAGMRVVRQAIDSTIVGFGAGSETDGFSLVDGMYISPTQQGQGAGSLLLHAVLTGLAQPIVRLEVVKNTRAIEFYEKWGFEPTDIDTPPPEPPKAYGIVLSQLTMQLER